MNKLTTLLALLTACSGCSGTQGVTYGEEIQLFAEHFCTTLQDPCGYDFAENGFTEQECVDVTVHSICDNVNPGACSATLEPHNIVEFSRCRASVDWYANNHKCESLWTSDLPNACVLVIDLREEL